MNQLNNSIKAHGFISNPIFKRERFGVRSYECIHFEKERDMIKCEMSVGDYKVFKCLYLFFGQVA